MSEHPVGERPEIASVVRRVDEGREALRKLRAVTALHRCVPHEYLSGVDVCEECDQVWPCETRRITDAVPL